MQMVYVCRHCHTYLGQFENQDVEAKRLGFHSLTAEERTDIITYNQAQNMMYVKTVCDYCQQALENHPELALLHNPLQ